eukprot:10458887-Lingulodinium_polyedra.AAC.1
MEAAMGGLGEALVQDHRPAPEVSAARPAAAPYVDNSNVIGITRESVRAAIRAVCRELERRGFRLRDFIDAVEEF